MSILRFTVAAAIGSAAAASAAVAAAVGSAAAAVEGSEIQRPRGAR